ncbi:MAG: hypothetical protein KDA84_15690 [Planctomycetaceae bacterium]|nr:hypothetical protein [Planctomycetaceae bacterium]
MNPSVLAAILLIAVGILFILAELTIGSDGSMTIMAALCWLAASWFVWQGWARDLGWEWWAYFPGVLIGIPIMVGGVLAVLPYSTAGRKLFTTPDPEEVCPISEEVDLWRESLIGERVECLTSMNPGGLILIDGERHHAESQGVPIDPGQVVEIIDVRGNRFVVRLYEGAPVASNLNSDGDLVY